MPAVALNVKRQLSATIKKFKFEELEGSVLPHFPEISWNDIRKRLVKNHENFTTSCALRIIEQAIVRHKIDDKELKDRLAILEVIDVSRHSSKKVWYGYELQGVMNCQRLIPNREMQERMSQTFQMLQIDMAINVVTHQGITFISMCEKKRSKRLLPVYFALFLRHGYFFCSKKGVTKEFLQAIVEGLGFDTSKKLKLMGRDLKSLSKMLELKKQGVVQFGNLCNSPKYTDSEPVVKATGTDFRQHKQRREYISQCFGNEPPTIDVLEITGTEAPWADREISSQLPNEKIKIAWDFKSHDVAGSLLRLYEKRIFVNPLPNYVTKLMETGKNQLTVKL
ncbi:uncharacterized protein [Fopius arisanus]|uniref:Uncharacterized protein n=1 Tax=Fopius arisanus TaxID=64838 RepID=A0A9R1U1G7_9HYME|nr:PREDICTED: uncharacterized protein LOC105267459 [Fopius arisanus]